MLATLLRPSLRAIRRNALRSALTMLGIVIGVAAVIAMVTMGAGVTEQVGSNLSKLGTRLLLVRPGQSQPGSGGARSDGAPFTIADAQAIEREVPGIAAVAPMNSRAVQAIAGSRNRLTSVIGSSDSFLRARSWEVSNGRSFSDGEERAGADLCVLGATVRTDLFGAADPVGQRIRLGRLSCQVVGALESKGAAGFGSDQDDFVLVPLRWYQREVAGDAEVKSIYVSAREGAPTARVTADLEQLLRQRRRVQRSNDFTIRDMTEVESAAVNTTRALTGFLGALAAVSMIVGGIGIMNIMLVSVTERTQEIGIRLAVGALERDIQRQFLMEAAVLAATGGVIGIVLGLAAGAIGVRALDVPFVLQPGIIVLAFAVSAAVGLAFGYYPARRAARLDPIEALRHE